MKILDGLIGGLAGALSVTLLHELTKKLYKGAPRLDLLGEQATSKLLHRSGAEVPEGNKLYGVAMAGDLIANTLYYGLSAANTKHPIKTAGILGISAGLGAINLPDKAGLNADYAAGTRERKLITFALYTIGGIVTGVVVNMMKNQR